MQNMTRTLMINITIYIEAGAMQYHKTTWDGGTKQVLYSLKHYNVLGNGHG